MGFIVGILEHLVGFGLPTDIHQARREHHDQDPPKAIINMGDGKVLFMVQHSKEDKDEEHIQKGTDVVHVGEPLNIHCRGVI